MTDKELIRQEIESYKESMKGLEPHSDFRRGQITAYNQIMQFIDSLPEEPANEDLEEAATKWDKTASFQPFYMQLDCKGNPCEAKQDITTHKESFKAGAEWQKQQLMKDAVYGYISLCHDYPHRRSLVAIADGLVNFEYTEKVKIIICKLEQQ